jgi:ketosteroid isomerase-like protein
MRVDDGRYLCVWRKVDDNWRIHRDIFNRSEPRA